MDRAESRLSGPAPMRSMWTGTISLSLITIPVRLFAATGPREITFHQVHKGDGGRVSLRRVCSACGAEVPYADIAKGHELPTGATLVLTDDELADHARTLAHEIEILQFAPADQVDPVMRARSYYLEPQPAGARSYVVLREALARSGNVAIAHLAMRQRERLAALRPRDAVLVIETLRWPDEMRIPEFAFLGHDIQVSSSELSIATSLIREMTTDFEPGRHRDHDREAIEELLAAKIQRRDIVWPTAGQQVAGKAAGLSQALRASLLAARAARAERGSANANPRQGKRQRHVELTGTTTPARPGRPASQPRKG